ncbi:hypothetical protein E2C01_088518 [Portunus trituberculatus]|uniref:Uncharacterized protein n=1 Tax=Portunus trituberculatus TaxID=210409 RepID=A0A5B7JAZ7_PORTR|nr:hypothetical protein [Portunus trituberculatus]
MTPRRPPGRGCQQCVLARHGSPRRPARRPSRPRLLQQRLVPAEERASRDARWCRSERPTAPWLTGNCHATSSTSTLHHLLHCPHRGCRPLPGPHMGRPVPNPQPAT